MLAYQDSNGHDADTIFDEYNGYVHESYVTPDETDEEFFYVYISDLEEYWVEEFGQEDWDNANFEEMDMIIQQNDPELFYCDRGSDDKGEYLLYTTNENNI